jgi:hypothetical protein
VAEIEGWLLPSEVDVETYRGDSAYGDTYAPKVTVDCAIDDEARLVRGSNGDEVLASTTLRLFLRDGPKFRLDSRVTVRGRRTFVIATSDRRTDGLGLGDHFEVALR